MNTRCQHWKTFHSKSSRKIAKAHQSKPARGSPLSLTPIARAVDHTNNCILSCMNSLSENENFILLPNTFSLKKKVKIRQTPKPCNKIYGFVQNGTITVLVVTLWQRKSRTQKLLHVCLKKYNSITFL